MTTKEFSDQFDSLYNQQYYVLFSMQNPVALDEYEKSLYLTKAQENIVETLYRAGYGIPEGFEKTEYARRILSQLVISTHGVAVDGKELVLVGDTSYCFSVKELTQAYGIIYEQATFGGDDICAAGKVADIIPVTHDDLHRLLRNPHRGPSLRRVLRVDHSGYSTEDAEIPVYAEPQRFIVELISKYPIADYYVRYIRKPYPIILTELGEDDNSPSIEGFNHIRECELNPAVHKTILEEAVKLALASKTLNTLPVAPQPKENREKEAGE